MANTLANDYYLKALDNYPYCLPEFLEAINYALSYDENHADAHCLMGRFYMEELLKFDEAEAHFNSALENDVLHIITYYQYIRLMITIDDFDKAKRLIKFAKSIKGVSQTILLWRESNIYEIKGKFKKSLGCLNKALEISIFTCDIDFYKAEKTRVKEKLKSRKKKNKK